MKPADIENLAREVNLRRELRGAAAILSERGLDPVFLQEVGGGISLYIPADVLRAALLYALDKTETHLCEAGVEL